MSDVCSFCGKRHVMAGETMSPEAFPGWAAAACRRVPVGFIYVDTVFASGPRGQLVRIVADDE